MKDQILESLRDYCERVYEQFKGEYPEFMVHYWDDVVGQARLAPEAPESADILAREGQYRMARASLAQFYTESQVAILTSTEETLAPTAAAVLQSSYNLVSVLTDENEESREILIGELNELAAVLSSAGKEPDEEAIDPLEALLNSVETES